MAGLRQVKDFILSWNEENKEDFYQAAKEIWENPELSMQEYESSRILIDLLKKNGFQVEEGVAGMPTAFIASYGEGRLVIGINAEYDALPGLSQDKEQLKKSSVIQGAPGHGCGHNLLGTGGVKAAVAIKNALEKFQLSGTVRVLGNACGRIVPGQAFYGKNRLF